MTDNTKKKIEETRKKMDSKDWDSADSETINEYVRQLEGFFSYEETRIESVESKSTTILGASALIATFIFGIVGIYQNKTSAINRAVLGITGFLLLASLILLFCTIVFVLRAHGIKNYQYPTSTYSIPDSSNLTIGQAMRERLTDLLTSLTWNFEIINQKVDYLRVSQRLFSCAVSLVILDALIIIVYSIYNLCC